MNTPWKREESGREKDKKEEAGEKKDEKHNNEDEYEVSEDKYDKLKSTEADKTITTWTS